MKIRKQMTIETEQIPLARIQENGHINFRGGKKKKKIMITMSSERSREYNIDVHFQFLP